MSQLNERTVPERVLVPNRVNARSLERAASFALGSFFGLLAARDFRAPVRVSFLGLASFAFFRRAFAGYSIAESATTAIPTVRELQRTVTMQASMTEIEIFFLDPPRLAGFELGRDFDVSFLFRSAPHAGTEVQARLLRWPVAVCLKDADRWLRDFLRESKQLIETGEVARTDERVHGRRSRWLQGALP